MIYVLSLLLLQSTCTLRESEQLNILGNPARCAGPSSTILILERERRMCGSDTHTCTLLFPRWLGVKGCIYWDELAEACGNIFQRWWDFEVR